MMPAATRPASRPEDGARGSGGRRQSLGRALLPVLDEPLQELGFVVEALHRPAQVLDLGFELRHLAI